MLEAHGGVVGRRNVVAPDAADEGRAHDFGEVRVFTEGLVEARPEGLTTEVEHGRERPGDARGARPQRGSFAEPAHQLRVPGRGHARLLREERRALHVVRAVYGVDAVEDWNLQTRARGGLLNLSDDLVPLVGGERLPVDVEDGADAVLDHGLL